ncbi:MAG: molybdenum cofactor biosynthesis protein MoaE [Sulfurovaceae bacterium]|nr:molybdenum cofactor biosynthesis protein MoaE [Sulfurovaceae bacterium]
MIEIYNGPLDVKEVISRWLDEINGKNWGAFIPFVGIVRKEDGIEALSFDIYEPILEKWFDDWQKKAKEKGAILKMAHSRGVVPVFTSSYISAVMSPKRRIALDLIDEFVEDFKANAPIWKYDVIDGERIYAEARSTAMNGAGLMSKKD